MENILLEEQDQVLLITINREKQLNALNKSTIEELSSALDDAAQNDSIRSVVITGSGGKAFVAGADIKEFASFSVEQGKALAAEGQTKLFNKVEKMNKPVIAAINGFALGGGLELAMAAHMRVASDNARMGLPEVSLGVIPGYGGTQRLAQLVGKGKALELITSAGMIKAPEALNWGLVNYVVPLDELIAKAKEMASATHRNSPVAIKAAIKAVLAGYETGTDGLEREIELFGECFGTDDFKEGTSAFMEKRKASFPGK